MRKIELIKQLIDECPICETERELEYALFEESLNVRDENIKVNARVYYCPVGKHYFSDLEDDEEKVQLAYREYRRRKRLLQPEEIKEIRARYGLSLREFADIVEIGYVTLQRYESGALQEGSNNILLKVMSDPLTFEKHFNDKKDHLRAKLVKKVESRLRSLIRESCQLPLDFDSGYDEKFDLRSLLPRIKQESVVEHVLDISNLKIKHTAKALHPESSQYYNTKEELAHAA